MPAPKISFPFSELTRYSRYVAHSCDPVILTRFPLTTALPPKERNETPTSQSVIHHTCRRSAHRFPVPWPIATTRDDWEATVKSKKSSWPKILGSTVRSYTARQQKKKNLVAVHSKRWRCHASRFFFPLLSPVDDDQRRRLTRRGGKLWASYMTIFHATEAREA
jgi:hypothetical protein